MFLTNTKSQHNVLYMNAYCICTHIVNRTSFYHTTSQPATSDCHTLSVRALLDRVVALDTIIILSPLICLIGLQV